MSVEWVHSGCRVAVYSGCRVGAQWMQGGCREGAQWVQSGRHAITTVRGDSRTLRASSIETVTSSLDVVTETTLALGRRKIVTNARRATTALTLT